MRRADPAETKAGYCGRPKESVGLVNPCKPQFDILTPQILYKSNKQDMTC